MLPFILRSIQVHTDSSIAELSDAISPYGYGGPHCNVPLIPNGFLTTLVEYMRDQRMVSFFGRISLDAKFEGGLSGPDHRMVHMADNVVVSLRRSMEDQWAHYEHKVRKNVNKARRAGLTVEVNDRFTDLDRFASLYSGVMDRRLASSWYHFDREFFARLQQSLAGSMCAAEVRDAAGELVSAELVLRSDERLFSFLGGTLSSAFPWAPNDLLKHAVISYGHDAEFKEYVLGGGQTSGDGIFRYKKAFDSDGIHPFYGLQVIGDEAMYQSLARSRSADLRRHEPPMHANPLFFPAYRAPGLGLDVSPDRNPGETSGG